MFVYFRPLSDVRTGEVGKLGNVTTAAADINQITIVLVHAGDDELGLTPSSVRAVTSSAPGFVER
jgi:hypothetical protein